MLRMSLIAAALSLAAGGAQAQSVESQVRQQLQAQGFHTIQVERDDGRLEVEARRGTLKIELKYDPRTGRLLSQRSYRVAPGQYQTGTRLWRANDDDDDDGGWRGRGYRGHDDDDDGGRRGGGGRGHDNDDDD